MKKIWSTLAIATCIPVVTMGITKQKEHVGATAFIQGTIGSPVTIAVLGASSDQISDQTLGVTAETPFTSFDIITTEKKIQLNAPYKMDTPVIGFSFIPSEGELSSKKLRRSNKNRWQPIFILMVDKTPKNSATKIIHWYRKLGNALNEGENYWSHIATLTTRESLKDALIELIITPEGSLIYQTEQATWQLDSGKKIIKPAFIIEKGIE